MNAKIVGRYWEIANDDIVAVKMVEDEPWSYCHSWRVASYDPGSDMAASYCNPASNLIKVLADERR